MDIVTIRIRGIVATGRYGTLESGDLLRTDAAFAKHLVEDCAAAEYVTAPASPEVKAAAPVARPRKMKGIK